MHVLCLDTREPRETQTQNSSQPELKTKSSERLGVDTGEHQRNPNPEQSTVYSHLSICVWTEGNTRETQTQEQSSIYSHLSVCVWTQVNTRETQTQEQFSIYSHLSIYVDRREHRRNPNPGTVHSLQSSEHLCGHEETPGKTKPRNSPQSTVI